MVVEPDNDKPELIREPLQAPFNEIIPTCDFIAYFFLDVAVNVSPEEYIDEREYINVASEYTCPSTPPDDYAMHRRVCIAEEDAEEITMSIVNYETELNAIDIFQDKYRSSKNNTAGDISSCARVFDLSPDDVICVCYESEDWKYQGPSDDDWIYSEVYFRVGRYIASYKFVDYTPYIDPYTYTYPYISSQSGGLYSLSPHLLIAQIQAVKVTISALRDI